MKYAQAINTNFSYQLTAIGGAMPSLHVSQGVDNQGQFIIQGGLPNHEVIGQYMLNEMMFTCKIVQN